MTGETRGTEWIRAAMKEGWTDDFKAAILFDAGDFKDYGRAYENGDGTIHLRIHSNLSYDLRKKAG